MTQDIIRKALEIAEAMELDSKYGYIGIRTQEQSFELGEMTHNSKVWDDGDETDIELDGVCCTSLSKLADIKSYQLRQVTYYGEHIAIIAGDRAEYGEDLGELIIADATVVAIIA